VLAYRIPNLMRRLVAEGALAASVVPAFTAYVAQSKEQEAKEFANRMFWTLALLLVAVVGLGMIFAPSIVRALTLGRGTLDFALVVQLNRVLWPFVLFIGLAALSIAILNSFRMFGIPALTPAILNVSVIVASLFAVRSERPAMVLAVGVVVGGFFQFAVQLPFLWRRDIRLRPSLSFRDPGIRRVAKLMIPGVLGVGVAQVNFLVNTMFATHPLTPAGTLMSLQIADRVMELVLGAYAVAIATAILPMMSAQVAERNITELRHTICFSLKLVSFITIPAMVGLVLMRQPIIQVLFQHGRFNEESTRLTAWALLFSALGLPWFAAAKIIIPAFYSTQDTRTPVVVGAIAVGANVFLNFVLVGPLRNGAPAASTSLAAVVNFLVLYWVFRRRYGPLGGSEVLVSVGRVVAASGVMGLGCWLMLKGSLAAVFSGWHASATGQAALLFATLLVAAGLFFGVARLLGCDELSDVVAIATRWREKGLSARG